MAYDELDMSLLEVTLTGEIRREYRIQFNNYDVLVTVTQDPNFVAHWISRITSIPNLEHLAVGFRVEWRRSLLRGLWRELPHRVDILQLCVDQRCLIFQIGHATRGNISRQLVNFLGNDRFTFAGVGIRRDAQILNRDYGIRFSRNIMDLGEMVARMRGNNCGMPSFRTFGLREVTNLVAGMDYVRPLRITMSSWNLMFLRHEQILYACVDAYLCYLIGSFLRLIQRTLEES